MRKSPIILALVILVTLSMSAFAQTPGTPAAPAGVVNINTADATQLALLPHVGAKAAQRIVDYRKAHGNFARTTDLMEVKGFGEKSFERLRPYLTTDGKTTLSEKVRGPQKARSSRKSKSSNATASK